MGAAAAKRNVAILFLVVRTESLTKKELQGGGVYSGLQSERPQSVTSEGQAWEQAAPWRQEYSWDSSSLRILEEEGAERAQGVIKPQGLTPMIPSSSKAPPLPKGSTAFQNRTISWGPNV